VKPKRQKPLHTKEDAAAYGSAKQPFRFIDLFCGIGGFRIAFEKAGCKCVFSSDYDKFSQQTYEANFGERPYGDIHTVAVADIPVHDILCAGFPCQPFRASRARRRNSALAASIVGFREWRLRLFENSRAMLRKKRQIRRHSISGKVQRLSGIRTEVLGDAALW